MAKNIFLITIDALRPDHLNCYGYRERKTSPFMDSLAEKGALFRNCFSTGPYTSPSFCSILAGIYPLQHGHFMPLPNQAVLVSEALKKKGYRTIAIHSNPYLSRFFGYSRGFDIFREYESKTPVMRLSQKITRIFGPESLVYRASALLFHKLFSPILSRVKSRDVNVSYTRAEKLKRDTLDILKSQKADRVFCWMHFMDTHAPYMPPESILERNKAGMKRKRIEELNRMQAAAKKNRDTRISKKNLEGLKLLYDNEISYVDSQLKDFFKSLPERYRKDSVFIITADHGEEFFEHGMTDHEDLPYDELLRVPLIIYGRDVRKKGYNGLVSTIDIPSTILDIANAERPAGYKGKNLFRESRDFIIGQTLIQKEEIKYAWHSLRDVKFQKRNFHRLDFYRDSKHKAMLSEKRSLMFNLRKDPLEKKNIYNDKEAAGIRKKIKEEVSAGEKDMIKQAVESLAGDPKF